MLACARYRKIKVRVPQTLVFCRKRVLSSNSNAGKCRNSEIIPSTTSIFYITNHVLLPFFWEKAESAECMRKMVIVAFLLENLT